MSKKNLVENTTAEVRREPMLGLVTAMPGGIEASERRGQVTLIAQAPPKPKRCAPHALGPDEADLWKPTTRIEWLDAEERAKKTRQAQALAAKGWAPKDIAPVIGLCEAVTGVLAKGAA